MDIFLFFLQDSAAPAAGGAPAQNPSAGFGMMVPFIFVFIVIYFMMIRPQRKQQKEREEMVKNLKKNDHVRLGSGLHGIVKQIKSDDPVLTLCIDERKDVCIRVDRAAVTEVVKVSGTASEAEPAAEPTDKKS
jgi:preprotein translocase subunit YajC